MAKNKHINVLSKAGLAAAFVSSAILTPAIIASAEEAVSISDVVVEQDGKQYSISKGDYDTAVAFGELSVEDTNLSYIVVNETIYSKVDYDTAVVFNGSVSAGLKKLVENGTPQTIETVPGKIVDGEVVGEEVEEDFEVVEISAINPTTIQVTFNEDVTEEALATSNYTLSQGTIEAVTAEGNVATISVAGLTYGDEVTVTVAEPAYNATVVIPEVSQLFLLEIETDAENDVLLSDGASRTQVTVTLKDRLTGEVVEQDGVVQFQATNGGLGQTTSALVDGKATVQLTSEASATSITSILTATISDGAEFKGLTAQKAVVFSPNPTEEETVTFVSPVYAEAKAGDRFFVQFSEKINAADYKDIAGWQTAAAINGRYVNVEDVRNVTENTLEFILDTDRTADTRIENTFAWNNGGTPASPSLAPVIGNYLRDNVTHTVSFPTSVGNLVLANSTGIDFILTDTSRPAVLGVQAKDQLEFTVRFTEAVDRKTILDENFLIDGREIAAVTSTPSVADIAQAKAANQIILTELSTGVYDLNQDPVDQRNLVTFKIHKDFALEDGVHQIQVANVGDYAQDVDPVQNKVVTDTFDFNVVADNTVPVPVIEVQSPEQWLVEFDRPVYTVTGKTAEDVFDIKSDDADDTFEYGVDYIVSTISENGQTGAVLPANASLDGNQRFLIEFTKDWTVEYDTANNPSKTYFASTKNPYIVTLEHVESAIGNKMDKAELEVRLAYDGQSPEIESATQIRGTSNVRVIMSEPVKNVTGNNEGLTPSQQQTADAGVPVPTYEFVKGDKVVKATASGESYDNYAFTLSPDDELEPGEWTLYIRSISDDIGNTSATVFTTVTIAEPPAQAATDTRIAWAAFDDAEGDNKLLHGATHTDKDVIYVKFTKEMKADGANGVSRTQNYVFMGQPLPTGSQVLKGIAGVTNDWDGVTIVMPKGTWNGIEPGTTTSPGNDFGAALNIASNFQAADGEKLSGAHEVELRDTDTESGTLETGFEALYRDAGPTDARNQVTFGGVSAIKGAEVVDGGIVDGKINQIQLSTEGTIPTRTEVLVNGKTFVTGTGNVLTAETENDRIDGTATDSLKITGKNGSIIINTNSVEDDAAPVITKAVLDGDEITLTFSEAVTSVGTGIFEELENADFTITGGATVSSVDHDEATPNKVVLTVTGGAALTTADTVDAGGAFDFAGNGFITAFGPITGSSDSADAAAASAVDTEIQALNFVDPATPTAAEIQAVEDARAAYDGLTSAQQALVTELPALEAAELVIAVAEAEALAVATEAVEAAEASGTQEAVDAAQDLVTALEDGEEKDALQARLDVVQAEIDAEEDGEVEGITLSEVSSGAVTDVIPGSYNVLVDLEDLQVQFETVAADSVVTLEVEGKESITLTYRAASNQFYVAGTHGYTKEELENAVVTVQ